MTSRFQSTPRFGLNANDVSDMGLRLDSFLFGAWGPRLLGMVPATRTFAYYGGTAWQDGHWIKRQDGHVVCVDDADTIVQRSIGGVVTTNTLLLPGMIPMAIARCESGVLTHFSDIRDLAFVLAAGSLLGDTGLGGSDAERGEFEILTAGLETDDVEEGEIELGALSAPIRVSSSSMGWLRLYGTEDDLVADRGRAIDTDSDLPQLEVIFGAVKAFRQRPLTLVQNQDEPGRNLIYYSFTMLEDTVSGAVAAVASDALATSPPGADTPLADHIPTAPGVTGWSLWEFPTGDRYLIWGTYGGAIPKPGSADLELARSDADLVDDGFEAFLDCYRMAVDDVGASVGLVFNCSSEDLSTWNFGDCMVLRMGRASSTTVNMQIVHRDAAASETVLASTLAVPWDLSSSRRFGIRVSGTAITTYYADSGTGDNEVAMASATLPGGLQDGDHARMGLWGQQGAGSGGYVVSRFVVQKTGVLGPVSATIGILRTVIEQVPL